MITKLLKYEKIVSKNRKGLDIMKNILLTKFRKVYNKIDDFIDEFNNNNYVLDNHNLFICIMFHRDLKECPFCQNNYRYTLKCDIGMQSCLYSIANIVLNDAQNFFYHTLNVDGYSISTKNYNPEPDAIQKKMINDIVNFIDDLIDYIIFELFCFDESDFRIPLLYTK